jgi:hypothetical protein
MLLDRARQRGKFANPVSTQQDLKYLAPFFQIKAGRFSIKVDNKKILAHARRTHLSQVKHGGGNIV